MAKTRKSKERRRVSARRRAESHKTSSYSRVFTLPDGVEDFRVDKAGMKSVDILSWIAGKGNPYADEGEEAFERTFWVHRGIGANQDSYVCPSKTMNKPCPICEWRRDAAKDPDADEDMLRDLAPKERQLWLLYDLSDRDKGLQIWEVSYHLFGKHLDNRIKLSDDEDDYEYFADLEEGLTLRLGFDEKSFAGTTYYECVSIDFKPRKRQYSLSDLDDLPCLDELLIIEPYDKLKQVFLQTGDVESDDDKEAKSSKRSRSRDDEDDDEEEEKPAPKRGRKPKEVVEEADDLDESEEEEEEEEKPKRRRKPAPEPEPEEDDEEEVELDEDACVACEGTGKNSSGRNCRICGGTGKKKEDEEEEKPKAKSKPKKKEEVPWDDEDDWDDEEEEKKPAAKKSTKKAKAASDDDEWDDEWDD